MIYIHCCNFYNSHLSTNIWFLFSKYTFIKISNYLLNHQSQGSHLKYLFSLIQNMPLKKKTKNKICLWNHWWAPQLTKTLKVFSPFDTATFFSCSTYFLTRLFVLLLEVCLLCKHLKFWCLSCALFLVHSSLTWLTLCVIPFLFLTTSNNL